VSAAFIQIPAMRSFSRIRTASVGPYRTTTMSYLSRLPRGAITAP
jgi:hypothetical protein